MPGIVWAFGTTAATVLMSYRLLAPKRPRSLAGKIARVVTYLLVFFLCLVACALGVLSKRPDLRQRAFAALFVAPDELDAVRCDDLGLSAIAGSVVEFGPGPGTNLRCWGGSNISRWVGVEPNEHFRKAQDAAARDNNITFERDQRWIEGEHALNETFDAAVMTHVLCSVDDPLAVLETAAHALKPGGRIYLMEHVVAADGTAIRGFQHVVAPLLNILADGCKFQNLHPYLDAVQVVTKLRFDVLLRDVDLNISIPFLRPHVLAVGTLLQD